MDDSLLNPEPLTIETIEKFKKFLCEPCKPPRWIDEEELSKMSKLYIKDIENWELKT